MSSEIPLSRYRDVFQVIRNATYQQFLQYVDTVDINVKNESGHSMLHHAIAYKKSEIALYLIEHNIDVNIQEDKGMTALHYISFYSNIEVASKIIEKGGDLNIKDVHGNNALWYAVFNCKGRDYDIVDLFMQYNSDIQSKNNTGRSPIDFAKQVGDEKLVKILQKDV